MAWAHTSRHSRGYGAAWSKLRAYILRRDKGLCQPCLAKQRLTQATQVDHIKPKAKGGTDDECNLQAICAPCHIVKTVVDQGGRPKVMLGTDGWPVEG